MASKLPDEYERLVVNWLRFNRRVSQPLNVFQRSLLTTDVGRFRNSNILNLDETPIPFEYLDGRTFDFVGSRTVSGKTDRSGWDKRQATLILYIFADGLPRIKPKLIFHAKSGITIRKSEGHLYSPEVTVEFNETAYNTGELFLKFIDEELLPTLRSECSGPDDSSLLLLDAAQFHKTDAVLEKLRSNKVIPSLIPGGCTGLLQPLDTAVNKPFKSYLRDTTEAYMDEKERDIEHWSVGDKRVMVTHVVDRAWSAFCIEKRSLVQKAFRDVGVTLPVDGSCDSELRIKGMENLKIGDWREEVSLPEAHRPGGEYQELPPEPADEMSDPICFTWALEEYQHQSIDTRQTTLQFDRNRNGTLLTFQ